jgi:AraC family transcriptional regulator
LAHCNRSLAERKNLLLPKGETFCYQNIESPISVRDLAGYCGLSVWHFSRRFKNETGKKPYEFISEMKIRFALRRLQTTDDPVKAIAFDCGYSDQSHFGKVFKKVYGISPGQFRHVKPQA